MPTSNIDDLLLGHKTAQHPETPENHHINEPEEIEEIESDTPLSEEDKDAPEYEEDPLAAENSEDEEPKEGKRAKVEIDDYGNEKEPENEVIRERLARQARKHQAEIEALRGQLAERGASTEVQQAARDFEYDPNARGDWQQQLASFVKQTVQSMNREQQEHATKSEQDHLQREFETKFHEGMGRFNDFVEVIDNLPFEITNPMTLATRAMNDPAAFLYAAAKRNPEELQRISKIRDPYAQMAEMGKLEERMRKHKTTTKAPRPLGKSIDNGTTPVNKKSKEPTIEDLIAQADKKKASRMRARNAPPRR